MTETTEKTQEGARFARSLAFVLVTVNEEHLDYSQFVDATELIADCVNELRRVDPDWRATYADEISDTIRMELERRGVL